MWGKIMINIVIVDSGVDLSHVKLQNKNIKSLEFINGNIIDNIGDSEGHGTAISGIISNNNPNVDITMIRLKNIKYGLEVDELISVLKYIKSMDQVDILNLSLGINICEKRMELYNACKELTDMGIIIVSAFDNAGSITYPAAFDNVVGVTTGALCKKITDFEYIDDTVVNIAAKGDIQRVLWSNPSYLMIGGNSLACAHVTAQIALFMEKGIRTKEEIFALFKQNAIKIHKTNRTDYHKQNCFIIKKAALFPFNKEMHSLIRYYKQLNFEITDIYDSKYSAKIGAETVQLLKDHNVKNMVVKNIDDICWNNFDTLILGHVNELSSLLSDNALKEKLIAKAISHGKNIYSFDEILVQDNCYNENIFYPKIDENDVPPNRFGMLYRISKPVVGVFGTSSKQGKFTLQLKLREMLLQQGYDVGQIGTEPTSFLFGMDITFPMGYNSSVHIKDFDMIRYLNHALQYLCEQDKDIILVGGQSGVVPYDTGNIALYTIPQINFLLGTQPDCVILCINPYDDILYIKRTIGLIESSVNSKVIALVVFPMDIKEDWTSIYGSKERLSDERYNSLKSILYETFHIQVYKLGNKIDMLELVDLITDYFV